ncbi:RICIN domain-containing protein [Streptomyces sp. TLI_105]|uniref:RICIN domain-containing protein n=1 Tax=Streptomyces sp. TLI_105 TaxID=1881019 RepID=UPI0015A5B9E1|nr:RICIN domain-containing protein [Streptomyces sp. TLI_105]
MSAYWRPNLTLRQARIALYLILSMYPGAAGWEVLMVGKRLAVIFAAVGMTIGLNATSASAAAAKSVFEGMPDTGKCLDYRADYGPYVTGCNYGDYQTWYWDNSLPKTALRQKATGLCLTARNGLIAMKQCLADDQAAYWSVQKDATVGALIKNSVTNTCLARNANDRVQLSTCTGGPSQRWRDWDIA